MNRKNVYLFTMKSCPHCQDLKPLLTKNNIIYKDIDIDKHNSLFETVIANTGFDHVPQLLINEWNGKEFTNSRFISDFDTLDLCVEQIKNILNG